MPLHPGFRQGYERRGAGGRDPGPAVGGRCPYEARGFAAIQGAIAKLLGAQSWFSVRRRYHDQLNRVVTFVRANSQRGSPIVTGRFTPSAG